MCPNLTKEYDKYDNNPGLYFKTFNGTNSHTSSKFKVDIGYERFLGMKC